MAANYWMDDQQNNAWQNPASQGQQDIGWGQFDYSASNNAHSQAPGTFLQIAFHFLLYYFSYSYT